MKRSNNSSLMSFVVYKTRYFLFHNHPAVRKIVTNTPVFRSVATDTSLYLKLSSK